MPAVYRGEHRPRCKTFVKELGGWPDEFKVAGGTIPAVSADTREKAEAGVTSESWRLWCDARSARCLGAGPNV